MLHNFLPGPTPAGDSHDDVVGIVVRNGHSAAAEPRTLTFAWGPEVQSAPSLPFGRWKTGVRAA